MQAKPANPIAAYSDRRAITLLFLGFAAGLPYLLIFSTLSLWLNEAGIARKTVTLFSWAALGYSFKFVWSPLIDSLALPHLTRILGKRRAWLILAQGLIVFAIFLMGSVNPQISGSLNTMAAAAVLLGFASATQDVVIDAYRIEIAPNDSAMQTIMSSTYTVGYRLGLILAGGGSLWLAAQLGSTQSHYLYEAWRNTYWIMSAFMLIGVATTLMMREPNAYQEKNPQNQSPKNQLILLMMFVILVATFIAGYRVSATWLPENAWGETGKLLIGLGGAIALAWLLINSKIVPHHLVYHTWVEPIADFFKRYGKQAILLLALIGLYRISDIVAGVIANVFYADLGYSKEQIALAVKTFGIVMGILGGLIGGILAQKFPVMKMMMLGAIAASATNLLFMFMAMGNNSVAFLYFAVGLDNIASGLATAVFIVFLSSLTNIQFTAVQYALLSSLMTLSPKILGGYSGAMVDKMGYPNFFTFTALMGVPILVLIYWVDKRIFRK
ncbi:AmpG family muropeptide MFS transporter [Alysiella filiformis]|uniref:MFS transporter, PAT family, beta-lactamase induction signal transducer AmpG n=1 Tax=Alysiella filiformis DSM 16848 TaxID=1120981 RepID=A0A286E3S5_9NEIS|nr:MFS transporter [Alysiella filiformis]QMT31064.1 MFS transporter [Alysiella filiformis]UBQ55945.1 MFS transporter [Alysiella filiformis DSM 16848]SOD65534.1 MFS transporter, PAT family, beta-lactamase induction signal transducer AmpG [Alysiella filiformis DSM 16848]